MKKPTKIALIALALSGMAAASTSAFADPYGPRGGWERHDGWDNRRDDRIDFRINELQHRIDDGARRGTLTGYEARRLYDELGRIHRDARYADHTGYGTNRDEAMMLNVRLDRLSDRIYFENHDRDVAWRGPRGY